MTVFLLRHGQTRGNLERRYIGSTDEPLCPQGREALAGAWAPEADRVYVSPPPIRRLPDRLLEAVNAVRLPQRALAPGGDSQLPLCPQGREALAGAWAPEADRVYVSPMARCRETAALLYPGVAQEVVPGFRETDFGSFEGHTYEELKGDPAYRAWLDGAGQHRYRAEIQEQQRP